MLHESYLGGPINFSSIQISRTLFVIRLAGVSSNIHPNTIALPERELVKIHVSPWHSIVNIRIVGKPNWNENFVVVPVENSDGAILSEEIDIKAKEGDTILVNSTMSRNPFSNIQQSRTRQRP